MGEGGAALSVLCGLVNTPRPHTATFLPCPLLVQLPHTHPLPALCSSRKPLALTACPTPAPLQVRLAVAGAFHTEYMQPAVEKLQEALAATTITTPRIPVISNVDALPHSDPEVIKAILARQVRNPPLCKRPSYSPGQHPPILPKAILAGQEQSQHPPILSMGILARQFSSLSSLPYCRRPSLLARSAVSTLPDQQRRPCAARQRPPVIT